MPEACNPNCDEPTDPCDPESVCLAEESGARLLSATSLFEGDWVNTGAGYYCDEIGFTPGVTSAPASPYDATVAPYEVTNGTSYAGLQTTCATPGQDQVTVATFDTSLEQLCRVIPLCESSDDLELTLTASIGTTEIASGSLDKVDDAITTTESGAAFSAGDHTIDLCVEHDPSGVEACGQQTLRSSTPLGSGVDTAGNYAGELAADFVPIANLTGTELLTLDDEDIQRVALPSGFEFPFYGTTIDDYLYVGDNGGINTANEPIQSANTGLPASSQTDAPDIAVYWDDLDPSAGGGVYAWYDGTRFIISWEDVPHGRDAGSSTGDVSVQAHIYRDGRVEFHYLDTDVGDTAYDNGVSATIGIGDPAGGDAVEVSQDSTALLTSGVAAVGVAPSSVVCLADTIVIPADVACTATDLYATVCAPTGERVALLDPDVSLCEPDAAWGRRRSIRKWYQ